MEIRAIAVTRRSSSCSAEQGDVSICKIENKGQRNYSIITEYFRGAMKQSEANKLNFLYLKKVVTTNHNHLFAFVMNMNQDIFYWLLYS